MAEDDCLFKGNFSRKKESLELSRFSNVKLINSP